MKKNREKMRSSVKIQTRVSFLKEGKRLSCKKENTSETGDIADILKLNSAIGIDVFCSRERPYLRSQLPV